MDISEKTLIADAQKLDENSLRVKFVLFVVKNPIVGPLMALAASYILTSALGYVSELLTKDPGYKALAVIVYMLFIVAAGYIVALQLLVKKLTK